MKVSKTTISTIENGKFNCSMYYLSKFAWFLGFDFVVTDKLEKNKNE
jgi:DNA-binding XRE family transcriptional regulator